MLSQSKSKVFMLKFPWN